MIRRGLCSGSFSHFRLTESLVRRLENLGITEPTEIQAKSIVPVLDKKHTVINAETGSGKTLCYLLPFLQHLHQLPPPTGSLHPRGLVLVPTQELAHQVVTVFSHLIDEYQACAVTASHRLQLHPNTAAIVSTPTSLTNYSWPVALKEVHYTVVDEADLMLSGAFGKLTWKVLDYLKRKNSISAPQQFVFCGATLPAKGKMATQSLIKQWLRKDGLLENASFVSSSHAHRVVSDLNADFVFVTSETKFDKILGLLERNLSKSLIFTNTVISCNELYSLLASRLSPKLARKIGKLDKTVATEDRLKTLQEFARDNLDVLVCTDLASRGLDVPNVQTVIQYDFPQNSAAFLHRAGRTARAGQKGQVISLVLPDEVKLAGLIETACQSDDSDEQSFERIFSRNRQLRKRMRAKQDSG